MHGILQSNHHHRLQANTQGESMRTIDVELETEGCADAGLMLPRSPLLLEGAKEPCRDTVAAAGNWSPEPRPYDGYGKRDEWGWWCEGIVLKVRLLAKEAWRTRLRFAAAMVAAGVSRLPPPPHAGARGGAALPFPAACNC
eukprot:1153952-Pelagomonas_calceolata.AAC.3